MDLFAVDGMCGMVCSYIGVHGTYPARDPGVGGIVVKLLLWRGKIFPSLVFFL